MHARMTALAAVSLACAVCWVSPGCVARAEPAREIPQSVATEHESTLNYLRSIAARPTPEGAAAQKVIDLLTPHMAKEEEFVLPPLVLLPELSAGKVTQDQRWAIPLADRVKAEQAELLKIHEALSNAFIELLQAAEAENDEVTVGFTKDLAADDLGDREVTEPTTILIGEFLRLKLEPTQ
jgi:hypothetical protein